MNINKVLELERARIAPEKKDVDEINRILKDFIDKFRKELRKSKIKADVFVGGSFAKGTVIKKSKYDVDVFVRFDKKHKEISEITEKILNKISKAERIHGSRDYFQINATRNLVIEIIPVLKISRPKDAENITDLSYFHVNYVARALKKNKKLTDEIRLAKTFCHAQRCYGAESYIKGFSGYALELLIINYGSFEKFLKEAVKVKDKIVLFDKKQFKNKQQVLMNINQSKLDSPIVFIDPTFKDRNALAALSVETFEKFRKSSSLFLKNPSLTFFEEKKIEWDSVLEKYGKNEFIMAKITTDRQAGDIAGSKLLKFYNFFRYECENFFILKKFDFEYDDSQSGVFYISAEKKKEIVIKGPPIGNEKHVKEFRKVHKKIYMQNGRVCAQEKQEASLKEFAKNWKNKNSRTLSEMSIKSFEIIH